MLFPYAYVRNILFLKMSKQNKTRKSNEEVTFATDVITDPP